MSFPIKFLNCPNEKYYGILNATLAAGEIPNFNQPLLG